MFFKDHWIANSSRDALIAARGQKEADQDISTRPKMIMDEDGIPHAFCISKFCDHVWMRPY